MKSCLAHEPRARARHRILQDVFDKKMRRYPPEAQATGGTSEATEKTD